MNYNNLKHIAVICNYKLHPNRIGGMDRFFVAYDKACKNKGISVDWFFAASETHDFYSDLNIKADNESVETCFLNHLKNSQTNYDVVVTHFVELCTPFFKRIRVKTRARIIAVDHNPRPIKGFSLKKRIKNRLKGIVYGRYIDLLIGVSKYTCNQIIKDYGQAMRLKVKLVYNGVDVSKIDKRNSTEFSNFIVASHLRKSKGIQDLIIAVSKLDVHLKQKIKVDVYGDGPYANHLKELVVKNELTNQIIFKRSTSELYKLYSKYSYMLQPTYMECFSLSILESLAANVPVITTTVGGNLEVIQDGTNGFIFNPGDINKLTKTLEKMIKNHPLNKVDVSLKVIDEFTLDKMTMNHLKVLKDLEYEY